MRVDVSIIMKVIIDHDEREAKQIARIFVMDKSCHDDVVPTLAQEHAR